VLKGWCIVNHVCREVTDYVRSCEHLLSKNETLTEDERGLLEYYVKELSRQFLSDSQMYQRGGEPGMVRQDFQKSSSLNRLS
jgi:hypothetical protein